MENNTSQTKLVVLNIVGIYLICALLIICITIAAIHFERAALLWFYLMPMAVMPMLHKKGE